MPIFPDDDCDDAIGRVRFTRVGWPKDGKRVRSEDRQCDHRYHQRIVRFHRENYGRVQSVAMTRPEDFPLLPKGGLGFPHSREEAQRSTA